MKTERHLRFRDTRAPHEIQFGLEREWTTLLVPEFVDGRLEYRAQIRMTGVLYAMRFVFEASLQAANIYSLHLQAVAGKASAGMQEFLQRDSAGWFDFWTRGLVAAAEPREQERQVDRYRALCDAALRAESHLTDVPAIQRAIVASIRAGATLSEAHKEGGTTISWERDRFVIADYGDHESRQEFADEQAFLAALWKRRDWTLSRHAHAERIPEIAAWKLILRQLRREVAFPPAPLRTGFRSSPRSMLAAGIVLVLAMIGFAVARFITVRTIGMPLGASARVADSIATLISTQEPYVPSLHRNPDRDRFRIDLRLTPVTGEARPRMISLARDLTASALHPGTKILGTDGPLLWMFVPELKALDLRSQRVITLKDLRAANPGLDEIWHTARFHFTDRMHLMSPDRQKSFVIDPDSLRAQREETAPSIAWQSPAQSAISHLCLGGPVGPTTWLVALSPKERDASFRVGTSLPAQLPAEKSREPRLLHHVEVDPSGPRLRILSVQPLADAQYKDGALVRSDLNASPLKTRAKDAFLLTYRTGPVLSATVIVAAVDAHGQTLWTTDTGLRELDQILPDPDQPIFIGTLPAPEGKVPEPVAVIIDAGTGVPATRSLRP